jgi:hypothetical protein
MKNPKPISKRLFALGFAAVLALGIGLGSMRASADLALDRFLSSTAGRFLVEETVGGRAIAEQVLGRALQPGEKVEALLAKLGEPGMEGVTARLRERMGLLERELPFRADEHALSVEQRATLRLLSYQELEGFEFADVAQAGKRAAAQSRRVFVNAIPSEGLQPRLRYPEGVDAVAHPGQMIQFGFESEFTLGEIEGLLEVYGPAPEFGITPQAWFAMSGADRVAWVKANLAKLFPTTRELGHLVKLAREPGLDFMPERLLRDETGNLEIVLQPVNTFEEWKRRVFLLSEKVGIGSMQGAASEPNDAFFGEAGPAGGTPSSRYEEDLGFFNFHNDLDSLDKLELGAARYARDPGKAAANSFNHPFLGPMTRLKQDNLVRYLSANARGELLDAQSLKFVAYEDSSFKYTGGTAYRPDIVPGRRVVLEVRDAHNSLDALIDRMSRAVFYLERGRAAFAEAAGLRAFDSQADFAKLPEPVQQVLREIFPSKLKAGVIYNDQEKLALEVFRNFAYPMRDWQGQLEFIRRPDLAGQVKAAQDMYVTKLARVAAELRAGTLSAKEASLKIQGALVEFVGESGLGKAYRARSKELLRETKLNHAAKRAAWYVIPRFEVFEGFETLQAA